MDYPQITQIKKLIFEPCAFLRPIFTMPVRTGD